MRTALVITAALAAAVSMSACDPATRKPLTHATSKTIGVDQLMICKGQNQPCVTKQPDGSYVLHRAETTSTTRYPARCVERELTAQGYRMVRIYITDGCR